MYIYMYNVLINKSFEYHERLIRSIEECQVVTLL